MTTSNGDRPGSGEGAAVSVEAVRQALREVLDPEYPISVVDMGLIRGIAVDGPTVRVRMTFTSMGCPCMDMIRDDIRERLVRLAGVQRVEIEVIWEPWSRRNISEEGWKQLQQVGVV